LIEQLDREYDLLLSGDLATLESCWKWRLGLLGRDVIAEDVEGQRWRGRLREVAFDGLQLEREDGTLLRMEPERVRSVHSVP
jgi:hypothetical protein